MKKETKKIIEKSIIFFSPIFTLIMYLLPFICIYKASSEFKGVTINNFSSSELEYCSYIDILKSDGNVFSKVIMYISLIGVVSSIVLYVLSIVLKNKEKLFMKVSSIVLVSSTGILVLSACQKLFVETAISGARISTWVDFMTPLYGLLILYNVACLIYVFKNILNVNRKA